ncbi:molybdopterin guanine dinucleotide-containing S/N-oxide reductase [Agrobacterium vitis]|uniref:molybdopterin guanine dinucleotide-containing S/N-oxide reductase n=1 Tax=Agrobacterium vitis TaxID=373 RepID=UPI0012E721D5|nr:molybdopterin guanine dinucleotide-containing S/N-oxide reductase [Agrobacterium vitis]MVA23856.1 molybdopterin-dependent oxidoreductase [Agrobacterium vitis]
MSSSFRQHSSHWGAFSARHFDGRTDILPFPGDPDPSPLLGNLPASLSDPCRILKPAVRRGFLNHGPGPDERRGQDEFVEVSWEKAIDLVSGELRRVYGAHGPSSVFGGSYGWSSAGRFHHAQSQIHRFLNVMGGYVRHLNNYSAGAAMVIIPHVFGNYDHFERRSVSWKAIAEHSELVVSFGGMAVKNAMVNGGGNSQHIVRPTMHRAAEAGTRFVNVSPLRDDMPVEARSEWVAVIPGTDVALMLGLAHTLVREGLCDREFLARYTEGYERFEVYLLGSNDGIAKTAEWAAAICGIEADAICQLAKDMAKRRTLITVSHSMQRAEHGEQPVWMAITLACMLGQIGLPGGGFSYSLGALGNVGKDALSAPLPTLSQGTNPCKEFIPVARISDMLLHPGETFSFNGRDQAYPHIRMIYWAGGNPFHHHQDINRLRRAFYRPETIIVHETAWTASARHADIVLPATTTMEREDIGASGFDPIMFAMHRIAEPRGEAKDDYEIFSLLAERLGVAAEFTEGRSVRQWLAVLYELTREALETQGHEAPDFEQFWAEGQLHIPVLPDTGGPAHAYRRDPAGSRLGTPSGKIEIFSQTIDAFGYDDCIGHPKWYPPVEGHGSDAMKRFPVHLVANQPATRLHSQLDYGAFSRASKIDGREPARLHPDTAALKGIRDGDVIRIFNDRGFCMAGVIVSPDVMPGVVQLSTGAWFDPVDPEARITGCLHGNPNLLTRDVGTSRLSQACTGQLSCVDIEKAPPDVPPVTVLDGPPAFARA